MLVDRYEPEDVFARIPEVVAQTDLVLKTLDVLLEDDVLYRQVRGDLGKRHRWTLVHGRHSTPVEVILRMLICKHLYQWSYRGTEERVADSLMLRWFCRVYFESVHDETTLVRWLHTLRPDTLHALNDRVVQLAVKAKATAGRKLRLDATCVQTEIHHPIDSGLLDDSMRALSRFVQRAKWLVSQEMQPTTALSLPPAHGAQGPPNPASATAAQRRGQKSPATSLVRKNDPDSRTDGEPKQVCDARLESANAVPGPSPA